MATTEQEPFMDLAKRYFQEADPDEAMEAFGLIGGMAVGAALVGGSAYLVGRGQPEASYGLGTIGLSYIVAFNRTATNMMRQKLKNPTPR